MNESVNLFQGVEFTVDEAKGLKGICNFIITKSPEVLIITAPVIAIVEAQKEDINAG